MRVIYRFPARSDLTERPPDVRMGGGMIPRKGDAIGLPPPPESVESDPHGATRSGPPLPYYDEPERTHLFWVSSVTWYPWGADGEPEPFVLVVLAWEIR